MFQTTNVNYYELLGVSQSATTDEIRAAYRTLVARFHPDINPVENAEQLTVGLNDAWETLRDPDRREAYDAELAMTGGALVKKPEGEALELPRCDRCGIESPTLSVVTFTYVLSLLLVSFRRQLSGLMCDSCRSEIAGKTALLTVLFGWWAIPLGPFYSLQALYVAAIGGKRERVPNAILKRRQGIAYRQHGQLNEALTCFESSAIFAQKVDAGLEADLKQLHQEDAKRLRSPKILRGQILAPALTAVFLALVASAIFGILHFTSGPTALQRCQQLNDSSHFHAALPYCDLAVERSPDANSFLQRAVARLSMGDDEGTISDLSKSLSYDPSNARALTMRCRAYNELLQPEIALNDCNAAILSGTSSGEAYSWRCLARIRLGAVQGALSDCDQAVALAPDNPIAYSNRCSTYDDAGDYKKALEDCNRAIALNPLTQSAYNNRCEVHMHMNVLRSALADCTQAIALDPSDATGYSNRCMVKNGLHDNGGALADCSYAISLASSAPIAYRNRCKVYTDLGKYEAALADCNRAAALNPRDAITFQHRCFTYLALHNSKSAQNDCAKALALDDALPYAYLGRGMARSAEGEAGADADIKTARELFHKNSASRTAVETKR